MVFGTSGVDLEVSGDGVWWMKSYELWTCIPTILGSLGNCQSHFTHSTDLSSIFNSEDATSPKAERYWKKISDMAWRVSWSHDAAIENPTWCRYDSYDFINHFRMLRFGHFGAVSWQNQQQHLGAKAKGKGTVDLRCLNEAGTTGGAQQPAAQPNWSGYCMNISYAYLGNAWWSKRLSTVNLKVYIQLFTCFYLASPFPCRSTQPEVAAWPSAWLWEKVGVGKGAASAVMDTSQHNSCCGCKYAHLFTPLCFWPIYKQVRSQPFAHERRIRLGFGSVCFDTFCWSSYL